MFDVNYLAIVVSAVAAFAVGAVWYSPLLFGDQWAKLMKFSDGELKAMKEKGMAMAMGIMFLSQVVTAFVLYHVISVFNLGGVSGALEAAFWIWLGFLATKNLGVVLWENKSWNLYFLNAMYDLAVLLVMALILGAWM